jgi:flavin-dependent dehydrogenase
VTADVAVVGGGPGGCAAALALRAHAPGLSIVLLEAGAYDGVKIGETLPPPAASVLRHLGVWDAFAGAGHREAFGSAAAWGGAAVHENDFMTYARPVGWQLDRAAFDRMLAEHAEARGVPVLRCTRLTGAAREGGGWTLRLDGDGAQALGARFVVDATGAAARFARRFGGARARAADRLAGFVRFFRRSAGPPGTLVESFADGWWYTAPLPGGGRVAACMTDSDLAREMGVDSPAGWEGALAHAPAVAGALEGASGAGPVLARAARSRRLDPPVGEGWIAVGDAAAAWDPLSSQGVIKALRSGIFAAYAVGDLLARGDAAGMERYASFGRAEWEGYLRTRARFYGEERRWPERDFWRRRQGAAALPTLVGEAA